MTVQSKPSPDSDPTLDRLLIQNLTVALRTAQLYRPDNAAMQTAMDRVRLLIGQRLEEGPLTLTIRNRCLFANGKRIRLSAADCPRFQYLIDLFDSWGLLGLVFREELTSAELLSLLMLMTSQEERSTDRLLVVLQETGSGIEAIPNPEAGSGKTAARNAFLAALATGRDVEQTLRLGARLGAKRLRQVTQNVVDQLMRDPTSLLALTTIRDYDSHLINHSANVAILSAMLGQRLGLTKAQLGELCLAAFLHDMGKTELPPELVGKAERLTPEEWALMKEHPRLAADVLLRQEHVTPSILRAIRVAYEHHLNFDLTGYPRLPITGLSIYSRVVTVADRYDAMTTPRPYRPHNPTPAEAIAIMVAGAGTEYDPDVLGTFVEMMGVYPVGTAVELDSGEQAVVVRPPTGGKAADRPTVQLLDGGAVIDLSAQDESEVYLRSVIAVFNPGNQGSLPVIIAG